jgi:hypothetical protein
MCESSAPAAPSDKTTQTVELPEWARGYAKDTLAKGAALTDINQNPYQQYDRNRIAGFSPMQEQAQQGAANMRSSPQLDTAYDMAQAAGIGALGANYLAGQFGNQFQAPGQYQPGQFSMSAAQAPNLQNYQFQGAPQDVQARDINAAQLGYAPENTAAQFGGPNAIGYDAVQARSYDAPSMQGQQTGYNPNLQNFRMDPAERVNTQSFAQPGSAEAYMSPYMQNVVDIQKREAQRQSGIQGTQQQAQAAQAGAFGGSRDAIMRAERERNLNQQMGDIQAQGSQAAYQQAQQQFNQEQQARLSAQQANQQAGLTVGSQNLNAQQQAQIQNAANQLQAGLANQQAGLTVGGQNLTAQQQANVQNAANQLQASGMNAQQAMQAALANQQAGLTTGQQNLSALLGIQQLGAQTGLQTSLANLNNQQQAAVQNQAAQLQTQGMNAQQALQAALANQQARMNTGQFNATNAYNTNLQNAQMRQQSGLSNQALQGQYGLQQGQFQQAANMQNAQQAMQAALANQQSGYNVGQQNLAANLGVQQLGSGQNLQAQLANQQAQQQTQQLGEQSKQYGAGFGLQAKQAGMQGYNNLGAQGQNLYGQQIGNIGVQQQLGGLQQQTDQASKQASYEDFLNKQRYPYQQLGAMSDAIRGAPLTQQSSTLFTPNPSLISQIGGLATAGLGAYGLYNQAFGQQKPPGTAKGGVVKSYAKGGLVKADRKPAGLSAIIISRIG